MLFLPKLARCVCRQAADKAKTLLLVGLARSKQEPIKRGHGAQYFYRAPASRGHVQMAGAKCDEGFEDLTSLVTV